jgi:hypothetical protein
VAARIAGLIGRAESVGSGVRLEASNLPAAEV